MAAAFGALGLVWPSTPPLDSLFRCPRRRRRAILPGYGGWRAMVQQQSTQGASVSYAREMERLSAKESLLLAFKDAGGFESFAGGKTTEMQRIDVNERIVGLERLNPTLRPTTSLLNVMAVVEWVVIYSGEMYAQLCRSPFLEGRWNFEWFGAGSPGLFAARFLFERSPATLANLLALDMLIKDGNANVTANLKFFNSIDSKFLLRAKLSVEGPTRLKEEYVEGLLETPTVSEQAIPEQLKAAFGQATGALQQLPASVRDAFANGVTVPLSGTFQRLFIISYLDEEILITRDSMGAADVLTRQDPAPGQIAADSVITEYES
ncbi:probable plastid-lipid-associated protein 13, chloroplastic isoform X1 [Dioscorea cayenensis subsp. rotundata]|uniref:Probable plastid-lipid-associated protein 13, chloroplastic isoform X1 n=1 Tax=Dioscorea cayennensis subsp. rotundata TaxID=55577 RepID=A0AB40BYC7_DIOCR|nr:probable plastid-lipid-associated protein 13, chloroplastic isoform X1 [Dioscorea cayenensis subsp. rotundata]